VRDGDCGRTALHDACWTSEPNEELVEFLIQKCPELLLLMSDQPFEYVRREHWSQINCLFRSRSIGPKEKIFEHVAVVRRSTRTCRSIRLNGKILL